MAEEQGSSSGCTAVTVLLRLEDEEGNPVAHAKTGGIDKNSRQEVKAGGAAVSAEGTKATPATEASMNNEEDGTSAEKKEGIFHHLARKVRSDSSKEAKDGRDDEPLQTKMGEDGLLQVNGKEVRRVLYTANVGDARAVLW